MTYRVAPLVCLHIARVGQGTALGCSAMPRSSVIVNGDARSRTRRSRCTMMWAKAPPERAHLQCSVHGQRYSMMLESPAQPIVTAGAARIRSVRRFWCPAGPAGARWRCRHARIRMAATASVHAAQRCRIIRPPFGESREGIPRTVPQPHHSARRHGIDNACYYGLSYDRPVRAAHRRRHLCQSPHGVAVTVAPADRAETTRHGDRHQPSFTEPGFPR